MYFSAYEYRSNDSKSSMKFCSHSWFSTAIGSLIALILWAKSLWPRNYLRFVFEMKFFGRFKKFIHSFIQFFAADGAVIFFIIHFSSLWSIFFVFWYDCYYYFIFLVLFSEFEKKKKWIFSCFWGEKMRKLLNLLSNLNICCFFPLMPWHNCKNLWCLNYFLLIGFAFCLRIFFELIHWETF